MPTTTPALDSIKRSPPMGYYAWVVMCGVGITSTHTCTPHLRACNTLNCPLQPKRTKIIEWWEKKDKRTLVLVFDQKMQFEPFYEFPSELKTKAVYFIKPRSVVQCVFGALDRV